MQNAKDKIDEAAAKAKVAAEAVGGAVKRGAKVAAEKIENAGKVVGKKLGV